jgi:hypothetical protein
MSGRAIERIENAVDTLAAALFAAAAAFAIGSILRGSTDHPQLAVIVGGALVASYLLCIRTLRAVVATGLRLHLPEFAVPVVPSIPLDELLLTDADRLHPEGEEALELNDILTKIDSDHRVVRLFDPSAKPTPGQLKARIDRHLEGALTPPDASQALFDALAELRRSLA